LSFIFLPLLDGGFVSIQDGFTGSLFNISNDKSSEPAKAILKIF